MNMTWSDFAAMTVVGGFVMGILFWTLRGRLANDFVTKAAHDDAVERLGVVETRLQLIPSHDDFNGLSDKVANVARDVAVGNAHTQGLKESLIRIERQLTLFVNARLDWEKQQ
jgi:hypothetical protein